ncbi:MAG: cation:proton antiporter [Erysipelotrichia bacterium]|nr:cation:proton antiporter [Erysipelotrichia bacterium]
MSTLFYIGIAMAAGLLMTRVIRLIHLPNVTAYLLAGVLIGPCVLNLIGSDTVVSYSVITEVALGFIAFSIGDEFKLENIRAIGRSALWITAAESVGAVVLVDSITMALGFPVPLCITLGAMAASTAPAATLLVVRQYKASGPLTDMLLPVVAADDATGLIAYSISISIAQSLVSGQAFAMTTILTPILNILIALALGACMGAVTALSHRLFKSHSNRMCVIIAMIFLGTALANYWGLSSLLLCMAIGAVYVNLSNDAERILRCIDEWTNPLFMLFFVISGMELDISVLPQVGLIGIVYVLARFGGKFLGSYLAASACKCPKVVSENIGWALMPQAGVAIGLASLVLKQLPQYGSLIQTVILSATLIYEIAGPIAAKSALRRAGEIHTQG